METLRQQQALESLKRERGLERKEHVELQRQADLQGINSMITEDGIDASDIFPNEVWLLIFKQLDNRRDLDSLCDTCPLFRNLLKDHFLYGMMLPRIFSVPHLQQYFSRNELLQLRLTCKSWRRCIDQLFESKLDRMIKSLDTIHRLPYSATLSVEGPSRSLTNAMIQIMVSDFTVGNPARQLVSRSFHVLLGKETFTARLQRLAFHDSLTQFNNSLKTLLQLIGGQIWHFKLEVESFRELSARLDFTQAHLYGLLVGWVSHMPNLKCLELRCVSDPSETLITTAYECLAAIELRQTMEQHPFPQLLELQSLYLQYDVDLRVLQIYECVLGRNSHVLNLGIRGLFEDRPEITAFMSHVTALQFVESIAIAFVNKPEVLEAPSPNPELIQLWPLQSILNAPWQLRSIKLEPVRNHLDICHVFTFLEQFRSLERVYLVTEAGISFEHASGVLQLPGLREFHLSYEDEATVYPSFESLFSSKRLEKVYFLNRAFQDKEMWKWVDLQGSSLWKVLPCLETLEVGVDDNVVKIYRRNGGTYLETA